MKKVSSPYVRIEDGFYSKAKALRAYFDQQFANPLDVHENRFVWDYWNVPEQYCHLRTPAYHYFPEEDYAGFHRYLVEWGRENLGCHDISPTWLSSYPEGSFQNVHVDEPHGPLAFVFSLTKNPLKFKGGRTVVSREKRIKGILGKKRELKRSPLHVFKRPLQIDPKFNRLVLFDPSYPHGVSETKGTKDPRDSRLVIHGWFIQPRPFWEGTMEADEVQDGIDRLIDLISDSKALRKSRGYFGCRIEVSSSGVVQKVKNLVSTLNSDEETDEISKLCLKLKFKKRAGISRLTIPLTFG